MENMCYLCSTEHLIVTQILRRNQDRRRENALSFDRVYEYTQKSNNTGETLKKFTDVITSFNFGICWRLVRGTIYKTSQIVKLQFNFEYSTSAHFAHFIYC